MHAPSVDKRVVLRKTGIIGIDDRLEIIEFAIRAAVEAVVHGGSSPAGFDGLEAARILFPDTCQGEVEPSFVGSMRHFSKAFCSVVVCCWWWWRILFGIGIGIGIGIGFVVGGGAVASVCSPFPSPRYVYV
jgi:hypothetical protein